MGLCASDENNYNPAFQAIVEEDKHINMIQKLVRGYIRTSLSELLPIDIEAICIDYFGLHGVDGDLVINRKYNCLGEKSYYQFTSILIKEGATLTVLPWDKGTECGGILNIVCFGDVIIERNAKIDLNGKGYPGGKGYGHGYSYKGKPADCCWTITGGGTAGVCLCSGGGGYGGCGCNFCDGLLWTLFCCGICCGCGGCKYGNKELTVLHLGSGGGAGYNGSSKGGDGGGSMILQCFGSLILKENSSITTNGTNGEGNVGGGGSGGSIHIIINDPSNIQMTPSSSICSKGGNGGKNGGFGGFDGGVGRIRIQCLGMNKKMAKKQINNKKYNIIPEPYIG
eukprot:321010_1